MSKVHKKRVTIPQKIATGRYPSREEFYNAYIIENLTVEEMRDRFSLEGISAVYSLRTYYHIKKTKKLGSLCTQRKAKEAFLRGDRSPNTISAMTLADKVSLGYYPTKEALVEYYITQVHSEVETSDHFGIGTEVLKGLVHFYGIVKSRESSWRTYSRSMQKKYGVDRPFQNKEIREKASQTCMQRYGFRNSMQLEETRKKALETNRKRYGADNYRQTIDGRLASSKNLTKENLELLDDKEKLAEAIRACGEHNTLIELAELLDCPYAPLATAIDRQDLRSLVQYVSGHSHYEREIEGWLDIHHVKHEDGRRDLLGNQQEIDIYLSDLHIGIEFDGEFWHSEKNKKNNYHQKKSESAKERGIFLYHIYEVEWVDPRTKPIILSQLENLCGCDKNKIYGRQTIVKNVSTKDRIVFLNKNHLQGADHAKCAYGLYYNGELISLMSFGKPRFNRHYDWELLRYCSKCGFSVVGGASKLFKAFVKEHPNQSILSYSDIAKGRGSLYQTLGFRFVKKTRPSYIWWKEHGHETPTGIDLHFDVFSRYQTQMKDEIKIMHEKGFLRTFDAGNYLWEYVPGKIDGALND